MSEIIEETERYRVRVEIDDDPQNPRDDYEGWAAVLTQLGDRYGQPDKDHDQRIIDAWEHGRAAWKPNGVFCGTSHDTEKVERYARAYLGAVAVDWWDDPRSDSRVFGYITAEAAEREGIPDPAGALRAELAEYAAYCEGDVYGYVIEERAHWQRTDEGHEDEEREDWQVVESVWGFYGWEYAEQEARRALSAYTEDGET